MPSASLNSRSFNTETEIFHTKLRHTECATPQETRKQDIIVLNYRPNATGNLAAGKKSEAAPEKSFKSSRIARDLGAREKLPESASDFVRTLVDAPSVMAVLSVDAPGLCRLGNGKNYSESW